jgi:hypothetical protein
LVGATASSLQIFDFDAQSLKHLSTRQFYERKSTGDYTTREKGVFFGRNFGDDVNSSFVDP